MSSPNPAAAPDLKQQTTPPALDNYDFVDPQDLYADVPPPEYTGPQLVVSDNDGSEEEKEEEEKKEEKEEDPKSPVDLAVERLNLRYAMLRVESDVVVLDTARTHEEGRVSFLKPTAFHALYANDTLRIAAGKVTNHVPISKIWWSHPSRAQYERVSFRPSGAAVPHEFNLWSGFRFKPDASAGSFARLDQHIREVICQGDDIQYRWVWSWMAHLIQSPEDKIGTSLVLRGEQGSGKSTIGEVLGKVLGRHYLMADKREQLVGEKNGHFEGKLLLMADEAAWAGDKSAEGVLKSLITAKEIAIRHMYVNAYASPNFARLLFTSNNSWVVPAGLRDRRFTVLDVSSARCGDHAWFDVLHDELAAGGYQALLAHLLAYTVERDLIRRPLETEARTEQIMLTADTRDAWLHEFLTDAMIPVSGSALATNVVLIEDLHAHYLSFAEAQKARHPDSRDALGRYLILAYSRRG